MYGAYGDSRFFKFMVNMFLQTPSDRTWPSFPIFSDILYTILWVVSLPISNSIDNINFISLFNNLCLRGMESHVFFP